ncbi:hypothetical protein G1H11_10250 [Phytoactinopolyspora alkaliphila]|uniref:Uncharacterized protein n=1 Tax=Phytoactinopolyspora alkaliphila TaxID=1783498 RepID=A0A6N9YL27_9ACTN|nr:hypothetical protein [Phytoactinopolyspora alkaliphila]NED95693.1 hypothetical protein [Phytoactinopolyspora alkaliphila]
MRAASQHLRSGDALLVGRDNARDIAAAVHVVYDDDSDLLVAYINALGAAMSHRTQGGATADEALRIVQQTAAEEAKNRRCSTLLLTGKIHRHNLASQYACLRAGLEPMGLPSGDYQAWVLHAALGAVHLSVKSALVRAIGGSTADEGHRPVRAGSTR